MLVLSRKESEKIVVKIVNVEALKNGDTFEISVEKIKGNRVTLGLEEPRKACKFVRAEIYDGEGDSNIGGREPLVPRSPGDLLGAS